ncbi:MAG: DUF5004 domain-containing protein [Flavisolibacter sp.]
MVKRIFTLAASIIMVFFLSSCTKDTNITESNDIVGTWAVTSIRSDVAYDWDGDGRNETDIYNTYTNCQQDIVLVFERDGYGQSRQGCNASWQNLDWQIYNNRTLNIQLYNDDLNLDIVQFTNNTIKGEDNVYVDGRNFVITYTLTRR